MRWAFTLVVFGSFIIPSESASAFSVDELTVEIGGPSWRLQSVPGAVTMGSSIDVCLIDDVDEEELDMVAQDLADALVGWTSSDSTVTVEQLTGSFSCEYDLDEAGLADCEAAAYADYWECIETESGCYHALDAALDECATLYEETGNSLFMLAGDTEGRSFDCEFEINGTVVRQRYAALHDYCLADLNIDFLGMAGCGSEEEALEELVTQLDNDNVCW